MPKHIEVDLELPFIGKKKRQRADLYADGIKLTYRERRIYEAGIKDGRESAKDRDLEDLDL